jgi:hypothetical protein
MDQLLLSIGEFAEAIGVGEFLAKKLIRAGQVVSVKIGDRRLVPATEARAFVDRIVAEATAERNDRQATELARLPFMNSARARKHA